MSSHVRFVSTIVFVLIFTCLLLAQAPIGFGPGSMGLGMLDYFDWYIGTPSGCSTAQGANGGARGMCVGGLPNGDTIYFTGWFANSNSLPVTTGLPLVGTLNDFTSKTCSGNLMLVQLAEFDWTARNASRLYEVNCMAGFGNAPGGIDVPAGWKGHCTNNDDGSQGCSWKSRPPFVRNGLLYLPVERQIPAGTPSIHDATLIVSADGGKTWKNPYTVAHGGAASATGDAPTCGAAAQGAGNPCTDASYPGSIMWPGLPTLLYQWGAVEYGQDGSTPPSGITDGCDPATYTCFLGGYEGTLARVRNTDLPSLDPTKWQYYTCPAISDTYRCPGSDPANWTSVIANRTQIMAPNWSWSIAYLKEFHSYLMAGASGSDLAFYWAPAIQGPWTLTATNHTVQLGFATPTLGLGYTVVSTNPPHVKLTVASDSHGVHTSQCAPIFSQWDVIPGRTPMLQGGENPRYNNVNGVSANAGYVLSDSHATGTLPRSGLEWAFDFYDHGGNTAATGISGFHDVANGVAFLLPCRSGLCGWNAGQGMTLQPFGASINDGYGANLVSALHDTPQTIAIGATKSATAGLTLQSAPAAMQGNGTFSVAGVFRYDGGGFNQVPIWMTGDYSGSNTMVALSYPSASGGPLELGWGVNANRWRYNSGFSLTAGNWYFITCTVQANGATPIAHMWVGVGGSLVDKIAGVSRAATGGTPVQTPNVAATPLVLGFDSVGATHTVKGSYAGLFVYNRALGQSEIGLMYQTVKAKMALRGVTLQ